jgi:hypothetical protein
MASKGGVNFVKFFFYVGNTISTERKQKLVALAYATARDQQVAPTAILIRLVLFVTSFPVLKLRLYLAVDGIFCTM